MLQVDIELAIVGRSNSSPEVRRGRGKGGVDSLDILILLSSASDMEDKVGGSHFCPGYFFIILNKKESKKPRKVYWTKFLLKIQQEAAEYSRIIQEISKVNNKFLKVNKFLNGSVSRDFWYLYFSWFKPIWAPDNQTKIFSNSFIFRRDNLEFVRNSVHGVLSYTLPSQSPRYASHYRDNLHDVHHTIETISAVCLTP